MKKGYDIIIIGSGPGGYVAAIRSAQLGYSVALIEKYDTLGGTCTNVGCIPSKALLDSSEHYYQAKSRFEDHGILSSGISLNFSRFIKRKDNVVKQNTEGLEYLMKKNKIQVITGVGQFRSDHELDVIQPDKSVVTLRGNHFIIATGSKPATIPGVTIDKDRIISSTEALSLESQPKSLTVIGGGVIGAEMASIFARIDTKVTILEYTDRIIPTMDVELSKSLKRSLEKIGVNVITKATVQSTKVQEGQAVTNYLDRESEVKIKSDYVLVAVGRRPYTDNLGLDKINIEKDERGFIKVNESLQTSKTHIYAIGDVVGGPMLAHKAEEQGVLVAETINGQKPHINYNLIPNVVYTWPEVASVGVTEQELKDNGTIYRSGKFPISALGRARAAGESEGFVKVLSDPKYGELLGIHIIAPRAADLIAQAVVAMEYEVTDEDMARISWAHPTYAEALKEAYLNASGIGTINI